MEYQQLLFVFCFYSLFVQQSQFTYAGKHLCPRDEAFYLLQFKQGITIGRNVHRYCDDDTRAKTLSWNVTGDCCEWDGVTCNGFTGHVIGLDLSCSFLNGTINANNSLAKLDHLQRLNLAFNNLNDFPLGNSISELCSLTHLNLSYSGYLEGKMIPPGLSKLSKLISLDLSWNCFQVARTTFTSLLAGHIPIGKQFNTFPNDSYCGNPDLCGFPLSKECGNNNESPLEHDDDDDDDSFFMSGFTWEAVVIGYGCGMIIGLLIGGLMFLLEKPKWYVNFAEDIAQQIAANKRTRQKKNELVIHQKDCRRVGQVYQWMYLFLYFMTMVAKYICYS